MKGVKGFQKGESGNIEGRKKGSSNVVTSRIRSLWEDMMVENIDQLKEDFQTLKPKERLDLAVKMSNFLLPRLQSIEIENYPDWSQLIMMTKDERATEIIRLKKQIESDENRK